MQRGQEYFAAENWEKARVEFRNALQVTPDDPQARFMNARVAEKLGNLTDAMRMYQSAIDVAPDHVQARAALGRMYVFGGAPDKALEMIKPVLDTHPEDPDLLTVRGAARIQQKDRAGALEDAEKANKLAPDNESAAALLASLYQQKGDTAAAIEVIRKTLDKVPKSLDLRLVLASLYSTAGENDLAEQEVKKVIELKPNELRYRTALALSYVREKKIDEAERTLDEAVKAMPASNDAKLAYVDFLAAQRSSDRAVQAMQGFIKAEPKNYELQFGLGALQQRSNHVDDAVATYNKVIETDKDGVSGLSARLRIATIDVSARKFDDASKLIAEVLQKNGHDNDALILRGNIALERGDATGAINDLRAVLRDQPHSVGLLRVIARAYVLNGDSALAEDSLRSAMEAAPTDVATKLELAKLYAQTKRRDQAVALLEEAVKQAPQDVPSREALVRAYLDVNDLDAARRAAEDLKLTAPNSASGPYLAGMVAITQKRYDDAQKELEKALQIQPSAVDALTALTRLDVQRGRMPAAIARVKAIADADAKNSIARNILGELYVASKEPAKALDSFAESIRISPAWPVPYRNVALTKLAANDLPGAVSAYETGLKATQYDPTLSTDLAMLYERQKRIDDAIRVYDELRRQKPRLDVAANNLAMLLVTYKTDQASLDRARDLSAPFATSSVVAFLDTHGWVRFKRGEFTQAVPVLERAVAESPESKLLRFHLGMAQYKNGQRDQAISNLEKALDGGAKFSGADEARSVLTQLKGSSAG